MDPQTLRGPSGTPMSVLDSVALLDLGRRAVACEAWVWRPRMLAHGRLHVDGDDHTGAWPVDRVEEDGSPSVVTMRNLRRQWSTRAIIHDPVPVLEDCATRGAVLFLVQRALGHQPGKVEVDVCWSCSGWRVRVCTLRDTPYPRMFSPREVGGYWPSYEEALVAALEAAPKLVRE